MTERDSQPTGIDFTVPSVARVYDALLGGKDNYAVDRAVAEETMRIVPNVREAGLELRALLARGVRAMVGMGIRQFIDLGSGLPTVENTHQIAQAADPTCRVVYVDNDPIVLAHGKALLVENDQTTVVTADVRQPEALLANPQLLSLVDLSQPVGLIMVSIIHHLNDDEQPAAIVNAYKNAAAPGSALLINHFYTSSVNNKVAAGAEELLQSTLGTGRFRTREEITSYFDGWELAEPGVVHPALWRPETPVPLPLKQYQCHNLAGLATKPLS